MITRHTRNRLLIAAVAAVALLGLNRTSSAELVAYWDFNEGSGTVTDQVSSNVGTLMNGASFSSDEPGVTSGGYSVLLDRTLLQYVTVPDSASLSPTGSITLSAWYKSSSFASGPQNILAKASNSSYRWRMNNSTGELWALINDTGSSLQVYNSGAIAPTGDWHHTALVADFGLSEIRFYVDGALVSTRTTSKTGIFDSGNPLLIGAYSTTGSEKFNGNLDEIAIWDQVIPESSILALANGTVTPLTASLPEPSTWAMLLGLGAMGLLGYLRRRRGT